jgi:GT2 family glycosyltransferase
MKLSIVVVSFNTRELLEQCLHSIREQTKTDYEIIVVDNASTDGTPDLIQQQFPDVRLIRNLQNVGFARACNQALAGNRAEYVLFLNPDTKVLAGTIQTLIGFMNSHPEAGATGPTLLNSDGSLQLAGNTFPNLKNLWIESLFLDRIFPKNPIWGFHKLSYIDRSVPLKVDWTMGSCLLVRREALNKIGGFDEYFFLFFEETDLCLRLRQAGYEIYVVPETKVLHAGGASRPENYNADKIVNYHKSLFYYFQKHYPVRSVWVKPVIVVRSAIRIPLWLILYPLYTRTACEKLKGYAEVLRLCFLSKPAKQC